MLGACHCWLYSTLNTLKGLHIAYGIVLVILTREVNAQTVNVTVRSNGAAWHSEAWTLVDVESWADLRSSVFSIPGFGNTLGGTDSYWFAGPDGKEVDSWETLLAIPVPQRNLTAVPGGRLFQWGPRQIQVPFKVSVDDHDGVELETVSEDPPVFLIHNLLSQEEASALIESALNRTGADALATSSTGFYTGAKRFANPERTSSSAFDSDTPTAQKLVQRAFDVARVNFTEGRRDGLQILRYHEGEAYIAHTDWFDPESTPAEPGQNFESEQSDGINRFATVFFYLQSPPTGGFTVFPEAKIAEGLQDSAFLSTGLDRETREEALAAAKGFYNKSHEWQMELQSDCYSKLAVKPIKLGAILFYHQHATTGRLLRSALHGACPSFTGVKWGANLWIWNGERHLSDDDKQVTATFSNNLDKPADLQYTMDEEETWVHFATIPSKDKTSSSTFKSHEWRLVADGKTVVQWAIPEDWEDTHVEFNSDSTSPVENQEEQEEQEDVYPIDDEFTGKVTYESRAEVVEELIEESKDEQSGEGEL